VLSSSGEVARFVAAWRPRGVPSEAGAFARSVVGPLDVPSAVRARSLLWAASRLCAFALECGLAPEPDVVFSMPLIERFIVVGTLACSHGARRTLRSNLLFLYRRVKESDPLLVPLSRERSQRPYCDAELAAYLALADAQPTPLRRSRASALIALGAGAGLLGVDLRLVRGGDVVARSGGVVVVVHGPRARVVPVRAELAERALHSACFAGEAFIVGGAEPTRRNVTSGLIASLAKGPDLERLSLARLRATWVARCADDIGLATFLAAAGVRCSQRLGDVVATLYPGDEAAAVAILGGTR
jgi:integrase